MKKFIPIFILLLVTFSAFFCQERLEFIDAVNQGKLEYKFHGNGNSTGAAVEGSIKNTGKEIIQVEVNQQKPLFLENNGIGQNLILFQLYYSNGKYLRDDFTTYLEFKPDTVYTIVGNSLCYNFEKPNPEPNENLVVKIIPDTIKTYDFILKIKEAIIKKKTTMKKAQCALWFVQGTGLDKINTKFEIELDELEKIRELIED
jgi:hypothetical protein